MRNSGLALALAATVGLAVIQPGSAVAGETSAANFAAAQAQATKEGRPVLVKFFAEWCGPCKKFAKESTESAEIKRDLGTVAYYSVDAEKGEGVDLAKTYNVTAYPTFLLVNAKGESIDRWLGYSNPKDWSAQFATAMTDPTTVTEKQARFTANPTAKDAALLARIASASREYQQSLDLYQKARTLDPKGSDYAYPIFDQKAELFLGGKSDVTVDQVKESAAAALASPTITTEDKLSLASAMEGVAHKAGDTSLMVPYVKAAVSATDGAAEQYKAERKSLLVANALYVEKDKQKALDLKRQGMADGWMEDSGKLNAFAWWCFENQVNLPEAEELARKGVALAKPGKEKAQVLDTVAEICNARGDCKDAVGLIEQAIKEDPKSDYYPKQLARFQKNLAVNR